MTLYFLKGSPKIYKKCYLCIIIFLIPTETPFQSSQSKIYYITILTNLMKEKEIHQSEASPLSTRSRSLRSLYSDFGEMDNYQSYSLFKSKGTSGSNSGKKFNHSGNNLTMATTFLAKKPTDTNKHLANPENISFLDSQLKFPSLDKQTTVNELLDFSIKLINNVYSNSTSIKKDMDSKMNKFNVSFKEALGSNLKNKEFKKSHQKNILEHLNLIYYSAPSLKNKSFREIQKAILSQWKQNPVLNLIRKKWYQHVQANLESFGGYAPTYLRQVILDDFKNLVSHLLYITFRGYFFVLEQQKSKGRDWVIEKLYTSTSHYIITQSRSWAKIFDYIITPILLSKQKPIFVDTKQYKLEFPRKLACLQHYLTCHQSVFPQTCSSIQKFAEEHEISRKLNKLIQIRISLEKEVLGYQQELINEKKLTDFVTMDKDDILSCIIFCLLHSNNKTNMIMQISLALQEMDLILGSCHQNFLSSNRCSGYQADLQAALGYIKTISSE